MVEHPPIFHKSGRNACGRRIPDADESITRDGLSGQKGDQVCRCGERRRERGDYFERETRRLLKQASI